MTSQLHRKQICQRQEKEIKEGKGFSNTTRDEGYRSRQPKLNHYIINLSRISTIQETIRVAKNQSRKSRGKDKLKEGVPGKHQGLKLRNMAKSQQNIKVDNTKVI